MASPSEHSSEGLPQGPGTVAAPPRPVVSGPASGRRLASVALRTATGREVHLREFRQRHSLILFFHQGVGCPACRTFLQALSAQAPSYREAEAVVLAIGPQPAEPLSIWDVDGLTLLSDAAGEAARRQGFEPPALVIADRFGDIWAGWEGGERHTMPDTATIADWLAFIDIQCPECTMIEWKGEV